MTCDESLNLISAKLDGELPAEDRAQLDAHLSECAACRAALDAMALQDAALSRAFTDRRRAAADVAERVIAHLPRRSPRRIPWLAMALSAAAGFALAFGLFRGPPSQPIATGPTTRAAATAPSPTSPPAPVAQLALATGAVEFCCPGDRQWSAMPTGGGVPAGTRVRTGPNVRCELVTADGSEVRLNAQTEVAMNSPRRFDVAVGQVWSTVVKSPEPFEARTADALFTAMGTQFDLIAKPQAAVLTVVEGSVRVETSAGRDVFNAGQQVAVTGGRLGEKTTVNNLAVATRWVNEILVMKGRDNPELARRIDELFAEIGQQKMSFLYEDEIRALGDHCVVPLARYIESPRSRDEPAKRAVAARIVSDVAPPWAIPELIGLLRDESGEVRFYAAAGLRRLTGHTQGLAPEQWRTANLAACMPTADVWKNWWAENHQRYPGAAPIDEPASKDVKAVKETEPLKKG